ncbi:MAG: hypothetical protein ERJ67_05800 [Aphanocapsa feldmannii 277cV]|uniref:Uncharacterized protein n=1 Tax=Aphanocapsa feldmannii 277cV TaxID=2507553 RepID=A0A524RN06_9CHRO|nr:MAG: hypothetical protein ERJ67_05800 [Aphanocapsa feldmannii 277cV]
MEHDPARSAAQPGFLQAGAGNLQLPVEPALLCTASASLPHRRLAVPPASLGDQPSLGDR